MPRGRILGVAVAILVVGNPAGRSARADESGLTLGRALEIARHRSPAIRAARANWLSEKAQEDVARANYYPSLTAQVAGQGEAIRQANPVPPGSALPPGTFFTTVSYVGSGQGSLTAQWTLYDFGHTAGLVENAVAQKVGALAGVGVADLTVIANTANAYMTLAYSEQLRDDTKATLDQREKMVALAKGLIKAGLQPPLEEIRASARAEAARRDLVGAEAALVDARVVLATYLGLTPTAPLKVKPPHLPPIDMDVKTAMRESQHLPAVEVANAAVAQYQGSVDANVAQYRPTLAFQGSGSYTFNRYDTATGLQSTGNAIGGLVVSVPIYEANIAPSVVAAQELVNNAVGTADQARQDAAEEAARSVEACGLAETFLIHAKKAAEGAAGVLTVVQARYIQGLSSPLELIDAETSDSTARVARTQAEFAYELAIIRVLVATGRKIEETS